MLDYVACGAGAGYRAGYEAGLVGHCCAGEGDVDYGAVGYGLEEAEEGDLVGGQTRVGGGGGADFGDVDWFAG